MRSERGGSFPKDTIKAFSTASGTVIGVLEVPSLRPAFLLQDTLIVFNSKLYGWKERPDTALWIGVSKYLLSGATFRLVSGPTTVRLDSFPRRVRNEHRSYDLLVTPYDVNSDTSLLISCWVASGEGETSAMWGSYYYYGKRSDLYRYLSTDGSFKVLIKDFDHGSTFRSSETYLALGPIAKPEPPGTPIKRIRTEHDLKVTWRFANNTQTNILEEGNGRISLSPSGRTVIDNGFFRTPNREPILPAVDGLMISDRHSIAIDSGVTKLYDNAIGVAVAEFRTTSAAIHVIRGADSNSILVVDQTGGLSWFDIPAVAHRRILLYKLRDWQAIYSTDTVSTYDVVSQSPADNPVVRWLSDGTEIGYGDTIRFRQKRVGLTRISAEIDADRDGLTDTVLWVDVNYITPFQGDGLVVRHYQSLNSRINVVKAYRGDSLVLYGGMASMRGACFPFEDSLRIDSSTSLIANRRDWLITEVSHNEEGSTLWMFNTFKPYQVYGEENNHAGHGLAFEKVLFQTLRVCIDSIKRADYIKSPTAPASMTDVEVFSTALSTRHGEPVLVGSGVLGRRWVGNTSPFPYPDKYTLFGSGRTGYFVNTGPGNSSNRDSAFCLSQDRSNSNTGLVGYSTAFDIDTTANLLYVAGQRRGSLDSRAKVLIATLRELQIRDSLPDTTRFLKLHGSKLFLQTGNYLWNLTNNTIADSFGVKRRFEYFPDGVHIAYLDSGRLSIVNTKTRALVQKYSFLYPISAFTLTPNWTLWAGTENGYLLQLRIPREKMQIQRDDGIGLASADTSLVVGSAVTFYNKARALFGSDSFAWQVEGGKAGTGRVFTTTFREPGWYTIRMTVRDSSGAATEYKSAVYVRGLPMSVVEESLDAPTLELLGNPSEGLIHVSTNAPTIRIWSSAGELLYAGEASKPLPAHAGTYLVEAISASGTKLTRKAVVY